MTDQDNQDNSGMFEGLSPEEQQQLLEMQGKTLNVNDGPIEEYVGPDLIAPDFIADHKVDDITPGPQAYPAFRSLQRCEHSKDCPGFGPDHMAHANVKERFDEAVEKVQKMNNAGEPIPFEEAVETVRNLPEHVVDHLAQKAGSPEQQVADINEALPDGVELEVALPPAGATEHDMEQFNDFISMFSSPKTQKTITNPAKDRSLSGKKRKKAIREARRLYGKDAL